MPSIIELQQQCYMGLLLTWLKCAFVPHDIWEERRVNRKKHPKQEAQNPNSDKLDNFKKVGPKNQKRNRITGISNS